MRQSADAKLCSNTRSIITIFNYALQRFKAYYAFHLSPPGVSTREHPAAEGGTAGEKFCLNVDFHVIFRGLLHAVKLRHGTDGFTSPLKEGVLIFSPKKSDSFGRVRTRELGYQSR
jgi:hypothetical protein